MGEPKALLEAALYDLLKDELSYTVRNGWAEEAIVEYVILQSGGAGSDEDYYAKDRGAVYEYQVTGISANRATALAMAVAVQDVMDGAKAELSVSGHSVIRVTRAGQVDYAQEKPGGGRYFFVGWIYEIELEEA
jgi:hypothetical protein